VRAERARLGLIVAVASLCACSGSHLNIDAETSAQLQAEPTSVLCASVTQSTEAKARLLAEMGRRGAIAKENVEHILHGEIVEGMNSCEAIAAWGPPHALSSNPTIDYPADPAIKGVAMVYDYGMRGKLYFDANRIVKEIAP
jgi:hypothetical protein